MRRISISLLAVFLFAILGVTATFAEGGIEVHSFSIENKFPEGLLLKIKASSTADIKNITFAYKIGDRPATQYGVIKFDPAKEISTEFFLRMQRGGENSRSFTPPGAEVTYQLRIEDADGNKLETPTQVFLYMDNRFQWETVTKEMVTAYYYGPTKTRAETILEVGTQTLKNVGELLGAEITRPIRLVVYNNVRDMRGALPFVSTTSGRGLITQGQAYGEEGVLLLLGGDPSIKGVTSHEITHLLVHQAAEGAASFIPSWLNEGLAEYGNIDPGYTYEQALDKGLAEGHLFPIKSMSRPPGVPDDVILFYGQSKSIVRFMVNKYGPEKLRTLLGLIKKGKSIDTALKEAYGFDRIGLDNEWRRSVGAPPLPAAQAATPTPRAIPTLVPFGAASPPSTPTHSPEAAATPTATPLSAPAATPASSPRPAGGAGCRAATSHATLVPSTWDALFLPLTVMTGIGMAFLKRRRKDK